MRPLFELIEAGECECVASVIVLTEVLTLPLRKGRLDLAEKYRDILVRSRRILLQPVTIEIAERTAEIRASLNLRTPDAIQLASAIQAQASLFVTNDLSIKTFAGLRIVTLDGFVEAS